MGNTFGGLDTKFDMGKLTNVSSLSDLFGVLWNLFFGIGLALSLIFVIVSGIKFVTSAGNPDKFDEAKQSLIYSIIAAIVIISFKVLPNLVLNIIGSAGFEEYMSK